MSHNHQPQSELEAPVGAAGAPDVAPPRSTDAETSPLVSAIIIFLDGERFLPEAIESILEQTYKNWELILVNDGSKDASPMIASRYVAAWPDRIRYLTHAGNENRGKCASRNLGLTHARGDLIAFLDADDVWLPRKLEEQVAIFACHPEAGMVYGRTQIWHSWAGGAEDAARDYFFDLGVLPDTLVNPPELFTQLIRNRAQTPTTCNAIIRRDLIGLIGDFEEDFNGIYEDQAFFAKVLLRAPVFVADACWARYRQHPDASTAKAEGRIEYLVGRRPFLGWVDAYIARQGIQLPEPCVTALRAERRAARHPYIATVFNLARNRIGRLRGKR